MATTNIEWSEQTWNPTTGCHKVSAGCRGCYAEVMHRRLEAMGKQKYKGGFNTIRMHESELDIPRQRQKPTTYFVNSMSDLFHDQVEFTFIEKVFEVMSECHQHTFQVLTKRSMRMMMQSYFLYWPKNVWMGVSVEDGRVIERIDHLRQSHAKVKFLSLEPLLGPLPDLDLSGIDWVIVGGESGPRAREMKPEWVVDIMQQCRAQGVKVFFKQTGTVLAKKWGLKSKKGGDMIEWPDYLQVREMPERK